MRYTQQQKQSLFKHILFALLKHHRLTVKEAKNLVNQCRSLFSSSERSSLLDAIKNKSDHEEKSESIWQPTITDKSRFVDLLTRLHQMSDIALLFLSLETLHLEMPGMLISTDELTSSSLYQDTLSLSTQEHARDLKGLIRGKLIDINQPLSDKKSLLLWAMFKKNKALFRFLLEEGPNVNVLNRLQYSLIMDTYNHKILTGESDYFDALLEQDELDLDLSKHAVGTVLHLATLKVDLDTMDRLVAAGAYIDATTLENKYTPLWAAVTSTVENHFAAADWLLARGANINAKNSAGLSLLGSAIRDKDPNKKYSADIAQYVIKKGISLSQKVMIKLKKKKFPVDYLFLSVVHDKADILALLTPAYFSTTQEYSKLKAYMQIEFIDSLTLVEIACIFASVDVIRYLHENNFVDINKTVNFTLGNHKIQGNLLHLIDLQKTLLNLGVETEALPENKDVLARLEQIKKYLLTHSPLLADYKKTSQQDPSIIELYRSYQVVIDKKRADLTNQMKHLESTLAAIEQFTQMMNDTQQSYAQDARKKNHIKDIQLAKDNLSQSTQTLPSRFQMSKQKLEQLSEDELKTHWHELVEWRNQRQLHSNTHASPTDSNEDTAAEEEEKNSDISAVTYQGIPLGQLQHLYPIQNNENFLLYFNPDQIKDMHDFTPTQQQFLQEKLAQVRIVAQQNKSGIVAVNVQPTPHCELTIHDQGVTLPITHKIKMISFAQRILLIPLRPDISTLGAPTLLLAVACVPANKHDDPLEKLYRLPNFNLSRHTTTAAIPFKTNLRETARLLMLNRNTAASVALSSESKLNAINSDMAAKSLTTMLNKNE